MSQSVVKQTDVLPQIRKATEELHTYSVTFFLEDTRACSGVLVNTCGLHGILTAYHVAKPLLKFEKFAMCIAEHAHALWVPKDHVDHVPIGIMNEDGEKRKDGPDLSFLTIKDPNLVGILKSKKSFSYLDSQDLSIFSKPLDQVAWGITGCPSKNRKVGNDGPSIGLPSFAGMAVFESRKERGEFDYLELKMPCDGIKYPADFEGLSGGGMWTIPLKSTSPDNNPKSVIALRPVLAGICYYQSEPKDDWRLVTGHGFDSIYSRVRQALQPQ